MRKHLFGRLFLLVIAICLMGAPDVLAQTQTGTIDGTVTDPNGESLPGVTVSLSGPLVMGTKSVVTNSNGSYRFSALLPGDGYRI